MGIRSARHLHPNAPVKTLLALFFILSVAVTSIAGEPGGWGKTRWGMTVEQVKSLYSDARPSDDGISKLHIKSYLIEEISYEVDLMFNSTGGLSGVVLARACQDDREATSLVRRLTEFLTLKYSAPAPVPKKPEDGTSVYWVTPDSVVNLQYSAPTSKSLQWYIVVIEYSKLPTHDTNGRSIVG